MVEEEQIKEEEKKECNLGRVETRRVVIQGVDGA